jgi:iron(III) transport system substrate-binding protein
MPTPRRTLHRALWVGRILSILCVLMACAPVAAPAPRGDATRSQSDGDPSADGPADAAPSTPSAASWDATVAAAKREARLAISVTAGPIWREALAPFTQAYPEIQLELVGQNPTDLFPRLHQERAAGQYLWDLRVAGFGPDSFEARDRGVLDPLRPLLTLPEVADDGMWLGGLDALFVDKEKQYMLGYLANVQSNLAVNRDLIAVNDLRAGRDLLDPRWKGKAVIHDPREAGAGNAMLAVLLKVYGESFVRDLLSKQDLTPTSDYRQLAEWVVRGRYPVGIGLSQERLLPFREQGLGGNVVHLREPLNVSSGNGGIHLINRAPHPNAAKVFVNWLLSRPTQMHVAATVAYNSRRLDLESVDPATAADPARLHEYVYDQYEEILTVKQRVLALAKEALP